MDLNRRQFLKGSIKLSVVVMAASASGMIFDEKKFKEDPAIGMIGKHIEIVRNEQLCYESDFGRQWRIMCRHKDTGELAIARFDDRYDPDPAKRSPVVDMTEDRAWPLVLSNMESQVKAYYSKKGLRV